jgi:hypothetical protein
MSLTDWSGLVVTSFACVEELLGINIGRAFLRYFVVFISVSRKIQLLVRDRFVHQLFCYQSLRSLATDNFAV